MGDDPKKVKKPETKLLSGEIVPRDEGLPAVEQDKHRQRGTFVGSEIRAWTRRRAVESTTGVVRAERDLAHAHKEEAEAREGWQRAKARLENLEEIKAAERANIAAELDTAILKAQRSEDELDLRGKRKRIVKRQLDNEELAAKIKGKELRDKLSKQGRQAKSGEKSIDEQLDALREELRELQAERVKHEEDGELSEGDKEYYETKEARLIYKIQSLRVKDL